MSEVIQWGKLTPQERDRLVAEKVMGLSLQEECHEEVNYNGYTYYCWCGQTGDNLRYRDHYKAIPAYSESLDAAWRVVEKIMQPTQTSVFPPPYSRFSHAFDEAKIWAYSREEACNEICVMALRALGYEVSL